MNWVSIKKVLSDMELREIEKELGIDLPTDYKEIIGKINGGALKNAVVRHPKLGTIAYSRNVHLDKEAKANIFDIIGIFNKKDTCYFPYAGVGNGDYFCFDLKHEQVVLYLHESDEYLYVCDTFDQVLEMIEE